MNDVVFDLLSLYLLHMSVAECTTVRTLQTRMLCVNLRDATKRSAYATDKRSLLRPRERLRSIVMSTSVCLSVGEDISAISRAIFTNFLCVLPISVAIGGKGATEVHSTGEV